MWKFRTQRRDLESGESLGPYRLEALLGEGGMGRVFRAVRESDGETVALKVLKLELSEDEISRKRFLHEARSAAEVRHEHLVPILDAGELDGRHYLAVAYVPGRTLEEWILDEGPLPLDAILRMTSEIASGLDALHGQGLVHRDIKASNILIREDGRAMLTDFGLARGPAYTVLTKPGQVMGTLEYIAPELIRGEPAAPASDIYALGCVVYECVTGKTPFAHLTALQVGMAHLEEQPPNPGVDRDDWSPELSSALLLALVKDPALRPQTAGAYARMLAGGASPDAGAG